MKETIRNISISISKKEVLRYLGYRDNKTQLDSYVNSLIDELIVKVVEWSEPQALYQTLRISRVDEHRIGFEGQVFCIHAPDVIQLLSASEYITFLGATLGEGLDERIAGFFEKGEYTKATILDAIGSDAVEQLVNKMNEMIRQHASRKGYSLTRRFSPGYGKWEIVQQRQVLNLLQAQQIGISLTEHFMLKPQKSITAIVGWQRMTEQDCDMVCNTCHDCTQKNCIYKKNG